MRKTWLKLFSFKLFQNVEIISSSTEKFDEELSDPSPSRSGQTLSSGDLADISSSMSKSGTSRSSSLVSPQTSVSSVTNPFVS